MAYEGLDRVSLAEHLSCHLLTPSIELKAKSAAARRKGGLDTEKEVPGFAAAHEALLTAEKAAMVLLYEWMLNSGWTGTAVPDLDALLAQR